MCLTDFSVRVHTAAVFSGRARIKLSSNGRVAEDVRQQLNMANKADIVRKNKYLTMEIKSSICRTTIMPVMINIIETRTDTSKIRITGDSATENLAKKNKIS